MLRDLFYAREACLTGPDPYARPARQPTVAGGPTDQPGTARALIRSAARAATVKLDEVVDNALTARETRGSA
jgi:hypothetical protein